MKTIYVISATFLSILLTLAIASGIASLFESPGRDGGNAFLLLTLLAGTLFVVVNAFVAMYKKLVARKELARTTVFMACVCLAIIGLLAYLDQSSSF